MQVPQTVQLSPPRKSLQLRKDKLCSAVHLQRVSLRVFVISHVKLPGLIFGVQLYVAFWHAIAVVDTSALLNLCCASPVKRRPTEFIFGIDVAPLHHQSGHTRHGCEWPSATLRAW
jgi:hypothetical protein